MEVAVLSKRTGCIQVVVGEGTHSVKCDYCQHEIVSHIRVLSWAVRLFMNVARRKFRPILTDWIRTCVSRAFVARLVEMTPNTGDRARSLTARSLRCRSGRSPSGAAHRYR